ncbi:MAG TPA: exo-alpha-sialidase [Phycisphaerae bacterium]|nr:exo-alpha-sialidase [Phycisphaerae bacterium]
MVCSTGRVIGFVALSAIAAECTIALASPPPAPAAEDWRNLRNGIVLPDEGYCDQPYVVITHDGNWLCTMTTGKGIEGQRGQHVVATISTDRGKTWSPLIDIEPADGPEASWAMPLLTPSGRVYVFYDYNGDRINTLGDRKDIRADMLGWYVYKYSDDHGRTWSKERYRLPVRMTPCDYENDFQGKVQMLWGIGKPVIAGDSVIFGFSKICKYLIERSEGWFFRSDNILTESDPAKIEWQMLPEGDIGLRSPTGGPIAEEQNLVVLSDGTLYTMYRTVEGHPCHAYSFDDGRTWTPPEFATYTPGGQRIKHPRACPRLWKTQNGKYLFWFHNNGGKDYERRNPAWISGGIERDGRIHWSQPEILLYDPEPTVRTSYPDLIEDQGRYWVTETQKEVARIHEIDASLLEGMWNQGTVKTLTQQGLAVSATSEQIASGKLAMPKIPLLRGVAGLTVELRFALNDISAGQVLLDSRDATGKGFVVKTADAAALRIELSDGSTTAFWDSDPGTIQTGRTHHVAIIVDAGPRIISYVIDGKLCDGGDARPYGWGRFSPHLLDINGDKEVRVGPTLKQAAKAIRIYTRALRTSEAIANYLSGE